MNSAQRKNGMNVTKFVKYSASSIFQIKTVAGVIAILDDGCFSIFKSSKQRPHRREINVTLSIDTAVKNLATVGELIQFFTGNVQPAAFRILTCRCLGRNDIFTGIPGSKWESNAGTFLNGVETNAPRMQFSYERIPCQYQIVCI